MDSNHLENLLIEVSAEGVQAVHGELRHTELLKRISLGVVALDKWIRASKAWAEGEAKKSA